MDFMKVFDQTVREIKREVNLKVLKVPEIEQKVLDATDNEPWGPHGTALAEIAQATKKFSECQMVMNVLWTRLGETGKDWRFVYKALAVVEYLISNGSERAVDEIIEHTFQISSLTSFEYVEPSGKDMGINVRKKAETIVALLNNKDKIEEVRNKAMANRDKYVGLSSTGITYKSGTTSFGGSFQSRTRSYDKDRDYSGEEKAGYDPYGKSHKASRRDEEGYTSKKSFSRKDQERTSSTLKSSSKDNDSDKYTSVTSQVSGAPSNENDDFDDFDPRGTSSKGSVAAATKQVDLFGQDLLGDFMDAPVPVPAESHSASNNTSSEVDLFADATFVSASTQENGATGSQTKQEEVDLFASSAPTAPVTSAPQMVDLFASHDPIVQSDVKPSKPESTNTMNVVDPFASVPLNNLEGSDPFGDFTSHLGSISADAPKPATDGKTNNLSVLSAADSKSPQKKNTFQVKSGIWADTLSRGLIDLNIAAPKKVSLVDVGVVGGLSDFSDEKDKKGPPATFYMGQAMGTGSGLSRTGYAAPPQSTGGLSDDFFSSLSGPQYQFGSFKK